MNDKFQAKMLLTVKLNHNQAKTKCLIPNRLFENKPDKVLIISSHHFLHQ
jgi:hypothetical protein